MAIPKSKFELQQAIEGRYQKLETALADVPRNAENEKTMEGHAQNTCISPNDLVAYLIGWNELVLKWLALDDAGKAVDFPETGFKWNALGQLAQKFYADYDTLTLDAKRARLLEAKSSILDDIAKRPNDELYGAPWHGKWTKGRMIQLNTSSPYENARLRLRKWIRARQAD
jgi:hypothetical protein